MISAHVLPLCVDREKTCFNVVHGGGTYAIIAFNQKISGFEVRNAFYQMSVTHGGLDELNHARNLLQTQKRVGMIVALHEQGKHLIWDPAVYSLSCCHRDETTYYPKGTLFIGVNT